jgi:signal peptidase I
MRRFSGVFEVLKVLAIVLVTAVVIRYFVLQPFQVEGSSMEPNFHSGQLILIEKFTYRFHPAHRGDVIVFHYPNQPSIDYIKLIIGLPGETVRLDSGKVYVDNQPLNERYLPAGEQTFITNTDMTPYEISLGPTQYFVLGDNRDRSSDSREWGPLDQHFIIGRSSVIFYPADSFRAVASPSYQ